MLCMEKRCAKKGGGGMATEDGGVGGYDEGVQRGGAEKGRDG